MKFKIGDKVMITYKEIEEPFFKGKVMTIYWMLEGCVCVGYRNGPKRGEAFFRENQIRKVVKNEHCKS